MSNEQTGNGSAVRVERKVGHESAEAPSALTDDLACPGCRRLQSWARTAWNRGHQMRIESNKQQAKALRKEKEAHSETNAMLTDALMKAEAEIERLKAANVKLRGARFSASLLNDGFDHVTGEENESLSRSV